MKKLKFIGFLVALVIMAASLTSCLSNDNNTQTGSQVLLVYYTGNGYGGSSFTSYDGSTTYVPTTTSSLNVPTTGLVYGDLCAITFLPVSTPTTKATGSTTTQKVTIELQACSTIEYRTTSVGNLEAFKADTAAIVPDSLKQKATIIGLQSLVSTSDPYSIIKNKYTEKYNFVTAINYFFAANPSSKNVIAEVQNSNRFYLYYDESEWTDNQTLVLHMARFTKYVKNGSNLQTYYSYAAGVPQLQYYSMDVTDAINEFKRLKGQNPQRVMLKNVFTSDSNSSNWAWTNTSNGQDMASVALTLD